MIGMTVVAHFGGGHWWEYALYLAPMMVVIGSLIYENRKARLKEAARKENGDTERKTDEDE